MATPVITNTRDVEAINKSYLIFGQTKTGKTRLVTTLPVGKVLLINVENNLDSVAGADVMKVDCFSQQDWKDIFAMIKNSPPQWVFIDSITAMVQNFFIDEFKKTKDGRAAYNAIERAFYDLIQDIKSLKCNVVCIAQQGQIKDEITGGLIFGASLPWAKLEASLPYYFSAVLCTHSRQDEAGKTQYILQCAPDSQYQVGVRTHFGEENPLKFYEMANLLTIHEKIKGIHTKDMPLNQTQTESK